MKSISIDKLWQPRPACTDARLRHWLLDRGSLTRRIQVRRGSRLLVTEVCLPAILELGP